MSFGFGFSRPANFYGGYLWTPSQISTDLWLDASDSSTITLNGSTVSQWSDKSGNGRHYTQPTAASQPGYSTGALNGRPILTFDGVDDFLDGGGILPATNGIITFFVARQNTISPSSIGQYFGRLGGTLVNGNWGNRGQITTQTTNISFAQVRTSVSNYATAVQTGGLVNSNWQLLGMRYSSTENVLQATYNSFSTNTVATTGTVADPGAAYPCRISARSAGAVNCLHMDIAEVVVLLSAPTTTTNPRPQIEGYLCWKYGLQGNLPASHPYKNVPPTI